MNPAASAVEPCPLCALPTDPELRCPSCGMTAEFGPDRPDPFTGAPLGLLFGGVAAVYGVTLAIVALTA